MMRSAAEQVVAVGSSVLRCKCMYSVWCKKAKCCRGMYYTAFVKKWLKEVSDHSCEVFINCIVSNVLKLRLYKCYCVTYLLYKSFYSMKYVQ